jgi:hypothetical protein
MDAQVIGGHLPIFIRSHNKDEFFYSRSRDMKRATRSKLPARQRAIIRRRF